MVVTITYYRRLNIKQKFFNADNFNNNKPSFIVLKLAFSFFIQFLKYFSAPYVIHLRVQNNNIDSLERCLFVLYSVRFVVLICICSISETLCLLTAHYYYYCHYYLFWKIGKIQCFASIAINAIHRL